MSEVQCTMRKIQAFHSREWFFCLCGLLWMGMSVRTASFPSFLDAKVFLEFFAIQNRLLYKVIYKYPSLSASSTPGEPTIAVISDAVCASRALIQWAETVFHWAPRALRGLEPFCQKWRENRNQNFTCLCTTCLCVLRLHCTWTQTQQQKKNLHLHIACCVAFCFKTFWGQIFTFCHPLCVGLETTTTINKQQQQERFWDCLFNDLLVFCFFSDALKLHTIFKKLAIQYKWIFFKGDVQLAKCWKAVLLYSPINFGYYNKNEYWLTWQKGWLADCMWQKL